jgi:glycosyltransferase involved in cell wall biosynthesis
VTIHVLGLPHTETTRDRFSFCAYTQKALKLAEMLTRRGHHVVLYAGAANDAQVSEHVPLVTRREQAAWFAGWDPAKSYWDPPRAWETDTPWWTTFNERAVAAIRERAQPGDILSITMGSSHRPVADAVADLGVMAVETGVGYQGVWAPYRVFESWAWRHYLAAKAPADDVRFYDEVIPNYFEPGAFPRGTGGGGYYLFIGRLVGRKGPQIAAEACQRLGAKLVVAGQGALSWNRELIVCGDGTQLRGDLEYVGLVGPEERAQLMGEAIATFVPTMYLEPFGGVAVESQLTGTPAITTDWGAFTETVEPGSSGYRCRTLAEFAAAAAAASSLDRDWIRDHAIVTWSTDAIAPRFEAYFARLATLWGAGWYA